jgi:hypothetical protein
VTGIRLSTALLICAVAASTVPASPLACAADQGYRVTLDGRPVDAGTPSGRSRDGVVYINLIRAVKSFDGLVTFAPGGVAHVTIGVKNVDFRIGSTVARSGTTVLHLPGAPFLVDGDEYVPVATIAALASAKITIDRVHHRELLTSASASSQSDAPAPPAAADDIVPSPAQALAVVTTYRIDAAGLHARADITNKTAKAYTVDFPTARQIEFVAARNGSQVWTSSQGRASAPQGSSLVIAARGTQTVTASWPDYAKAGAGRYTLRVRILLPIPLDEPPVSLEVAAPSPAPAS